MSKRMKVKLAIATAGVLTLVAVSLKYPQYAETVAKAFVLLCAGV